MRQLLSVKDLQVNFKTNLGEVQAVQGVSFDLAAGEAIAIVGESGCGKSVTAHSIMKLIPTPPGRIVSGQIIFDGQDLLLKNEKEMRKIRGGNIAMIFQESITSLNPTIKIGNQIMEVLKSHSEIPASEQKQRALEIFSMAGLPDPGKIFKQYPHQLSGGMRQRAMVAMALAGNPRLLIADEPTTALDVTIQAQILELLQGLRKKLGKSILLITHDLGIAAGFASRVIVMYAGKIVESGTTRDIFYHPGHPYTRGLLASVPRPGQQKKLSPIPGRPPDLLNPPQGCAFWPRCSQAMLICRELQPPETYISGFHQVRCWLTHRYATDDHLKNNREILEHKVLVEIDLKKLVEIKSLKKNFNVGRKQVLTAVNNVSINIFKGETLGLVGESGCGKTTLGRITVGLYKPTSGQVIYDGLDVHKTGNRHKKTLKKRMQMIFQDPYASLNPRMTAGEIIGEAIDLYGHVNKRNRRERIIELLQTVGLNPDHSGRFPHEFSGGQRQRIAIARALAVEPEFIVFDEPLTALDASIQAQLVNLLEDLQKQKGLTYLFISHDLSMVRHICNRVAVMYLGQVVELAVKNELFKNPLHPYTQVLLSAIPVPDPDIEVTRRRIVLPGEVSNPVNPSFGCIFSSRCPKAEAKCSQTAPVLSEKGSGHFVACHWA